MKVNGTQTRTIWAERDGAIGAIDQTLLPHRYATIRLETVEQAAHAIKSMQVRGAPLIGAAAAYGMAGEGPITDPIKLGPALKRGLASVKKGMPYMIDVITQPR